MADAPSCRPAHSRAVVPPARPAPREPPAPRNVAARPFVRHTTEKHFRVCHRRRGRFSSYRLSQVSLKISGCPAHPRCPSPRREARPPRALARGRASLQPTLPLHGFRDLSAPRETPHADPASPPPTGPARPHGPSPALPLPHALPRRLPRPPGQGRAGPHPGLRGGGDGYGDGDRSFLFFFLFFFRLRPAAASPAWQVLRGRARAAALASGLPRRGGSGRRRTPPHGAWSRRQRARRPPPWLPRAVVSPAPAAMLDRAAAGAGPELEV